MLLDVRVFAVMGLAIFVTGCGSTSADTQSTTPRGATSASASAGGSTAAPVLTPPGPAEEDFSAWVGTYPFEESAPGFGWTYQIKIEKMPEGYRAHLTIDGNQVATRVLCKLRNAGPNKVDLLYLRDEPENMSAPRTANEHLLSLERAANGKAEYRWAALKPNLEPPKEGPAEIGDANAYVKKYPADFLAVKAVKARLEKLLGATEHKRFDEFIATQDPIKKNGDFLEMEGFFPHSGGAQKAMVLYDIKADKLHVMLRDEEKSGTLDAYSEKWTGLPKSVDDKIKEWSVGTAKVTRHK